MGRTAGGERPGGDTHKPLLLLPQVLVFHLPWSGLALGPEWSQSGHKAMAGHKRPHPHPVPRPGSCSWTQFRKTPSSHPSPGPDWGRGLCQDGCWRVRPLWEQEWWVPAGVVTGVRGRRGQAISATGSDGKGWSGDGGQTPNPGLRDSGTSGLLLPGPAGLCHHLGWVLALLSPFLPAPLLTSSSP